MATIDVDRDSHINFEEFAARFQIVFTPQQVATDTDVGTPGEFDFKSKPLLHVPSWRVASATVPTAAARHSESTIAAAAATAALDKATRDALKRIGSALIATGEDAAQLFSDMDTNGDGTVSVQEFSNALRNLELRFSKLEMRKIIAAIDANSSGMIDYVEFVAAFKVEDTLQEGTKTSKSRAKRSKVAATGSRSSTGAGVGAGAGAGAGSDASVGTLDVSSSAGGQGAPPVQPWERRVIDHIVNTLYDGGGITLQIPVLMCAWLMSCVPGLSIVSSSLQYFKCTTYMAVGA